MIKNLRGILYRALQFILLGVLAYGFAQTLPFDLAVLFAGDMLLYVEVATAVWLATQVTRLRLAFDYARAVVSSGWRASRRQVGRARRSAARRLGRRNADDDRPARHLEPAFVIGPVAC